MVPARDHRQTGGGVEGQNGLANKGEDNERSDDGGRRTGKSRGLKAAAENLGDGRDQIDVTGFDEDEHARGAPVRCCWKPTLSDVRLAIVSDKCM